MLTRNVTVRIVTIFLTFIMPSFGNAGGVYTSPPSILEECMDSGGYNQFKSPSARARECTRVFCETEEFVIKIKKYAMRINQSEQDNLDALICIARKERDMKNDQ